MKNSLFSKGSVFAALDIGSRKIACVIAETTDNGYALDVLGYGYRSSCGIKNGVVTNLQEAELSIREAVNCAEKMAYQKLKGYPLRDVIIGYPDTHLYSRLIRTGVGIAGHEIDENDLFRALRKAQENSYEENLELIHTIPVACSVDGAENVKNPEGMLGNRMDVDINLMKGESGITGNLLKAVESSHLDVIALCSSAYASGLSCLVEDETDLGCTIIDMGAENTSFAVFYGGKVIYSGGVPLGGSRITADIARVLTTSIASAERLKTLYGSALSGPNDEFELLDVPILGEENEGGINNVPRSHLVGTIQMGIEDILAQVRTAIEDSGVSGFAGRRVVLTGGCSQLPGIRDLAQKILGKQVRLGKPIRPERMPVDACGPEFATVAGLMLYATRRATEIPEEIDAGSESLPIWQQVISWFKENW